MKKKKLQEKNKINKCSIDKLQGSSICWALLVILILTFH